MLPGIVLAICYIISIAITVRVKPELAPKGKKYSWKEKLIAIKGGLGMIILFAIVIGGMFAKLLSANEASCVGAFVGLLFMAFKRQLTWKNFVACLRDTLKTTGMVLFILIGAYVFGQFLAFSQLPMTLAAWVGRSECQPLCGPAGGYHHVCDPGLLHGLSGHGDADRAHLQAHL